ncbi:MAG: amidohydrolase family protein, partial [Gammaproteobacteria bacterium]|nr:amidohydrolase family protein [Gammaproteobacteria bacterium]
IADQANALGMPFAGRGPVSVGVLGAIDKGIATIDHLDGYMAALVPANADSTGGYGGFFDVLLANDVDERRIGMLVAKTIEAGVANVPTQTLFEQLVSNTPAGDLATRAEMQYMDNKVVQEWVGRKQQTVSEKGFSVEVASRAIAIRRNLIRSLHQAGGVLLLGSDAPQIFNVPGFSLHRELELMVAAGLSPWEALRSGTVAPAGFLGINAGTVETGKLADLVLLDANPIEDISNSHRVHGVITGDKWYRATALLSEAR